MGNKTKNPQDEGVNAELKKVNTINTGIVTQSIAIVNNNVNKTEEIELNFNNDFNNGFGNSPNNDFDNNLDDFDEICRQAEEFEEATKSSPKTTNPDFLPVSWHLDFTQVKYELPTGVKGGKEKKVTTLRKFLKAIESIPEENRPSSTITPLLVVENMQILLNHYGFELKHNVITGACDTFQNGTQGDTLENVTQAIWDNCEKHSWRLPKERLTSLLVAISKTNKYNPIEEYLLNCNKGYKGEDIIAELCNTIKSNTPQKELYIKKFLVQMVALAVCPEESTIAGQYLLVLQSKQGLGKTTWFQNLLPKKMQNKYFLGGRNLDPSNKDHILETVTNWLVEMGEIASTFKKSDQEELKAFITGYKDRVRPPYGKEAVDKKRRTTLCGTTNDTEYLRDETGSRRFLTISCQDIEYNHDIDLDQLWGQVYSLYLDGYKYYFTPEENDGITEANNAYKVKTDLQLLLESFYNLYPTEEAPKDTPFGGEWLTSKQMAIHIYNTKSCTEESPSPVMIGKILKKINVLSKVGKNNSTLFLVQKL